MLVSEEVVSELYENAGDNRYQKALEYVKQGKVTITKVIYEDKNNFDLHGMVNGTEIYDTYICVKDGEIENLACNCPDYASHYSSCKHIVATLLEFVSNPVYSKLYLKKGETIKKQMAESKTGEYRSFKQIINTFYNEEMEKGEEQEKIIIDRRNIKLVPKLLYDGYYKEIKVEFKIGEDKLYKIKSLPEFYDKMLNKEKFKYGNKLEFIHDRENFEPASRPILDFIMKHAEIIKFVNSSGNAGYRYYGKILSDNCIILSNSGLDEFFEMLKGKNIAIQEDREEKQITFIPTSPNILFKLEQIENSEEFVIYPNIEVYDYTILEGKEYTYILMEDYLYRCSKEYKETILKMLEIFRKNFTKEIKFSKKELPDFFSLVVPKLKSNLNIEKIDTKVMEKYIPKKLQVKLYLDFDKDNFVIADVKFCYGEVEFNPLDIEEKVNVPRNVVQETNSLNLFRKTGFLFDKANKRFILVSDDSIYNFLSNEIEIYMNKFEVLVTDNFKSKEIKQPKLGSIGVKVENNLLNIDLTGLEFDRNELKEILKKYNIKKKYHRLKDRKLFRIRTK